MQIPKPSKLAIPLSTLTKIEVESQAAMVHICLIKCWGVWGIFPP